MWWLLLYAFVVVASALVLWRQNHHLLPNEVRAIQPTSYMFLVIILAVFVGLALLLIFNPDIDYFLETGDFAPAS